MKILVIRTCGTLHRTDKCGGNLTAQENWAPQRDFSWVDGEEEVDLRDILWEELASFQQGPDTGY